MTKISLSWLDLKPNTEYNGNIEHFYKYIKRIRSYLIKYDHIPEIIFEQWIRGLHDNYNTLKNYAWLDYEEIVFDLIEWPSKKFVHLNVIEEFSYYVESKKSYKDVNTFSCGPLELESWVNKGTWVTPPIILDVSSINKEIPKWSNIKGLFQLVEGHTRLGYLLSLIRQNEENNTKLASKHLVYIMRKKKKPSFENTYNESIIPLTDEEIKKYKELTPEEIKKDEVDFNDLF